MAIATETFQGAQREEDGFRENSTPEEAPENYVFHKLCPAEEIEEDKGKPFTVNGVHLAVFKYEGKFQAVDNRLFEPRRHRPESQV